MVVGASIARQPDKSVAKSHLISGEAECNRPKGVWHHLCMKNMREGAETLPYNKIDY